MKWTKRTAALAAALLLLLMAARALGPSKAAPRQETASALIRAETASEAGEVRKIPVLPVVPQSPLQPEITVLPPLSESPEQRQVEIVPEETVPAASGTGRSEASRSAQNGPCFPEAEDWQLLLVNPWNELPEDYTVNLRTLPDGMKVDERAYDSLTAMLQACRDAGLNPKICSAYRTQSKQTYLYNNKISRLRNAGYSKEAAVAEAGRWVARPGTSEHQLGLAVDIVSSSYQGLTKKQERTAEQRWLMEHCWEYGFILRYPSDKSEITGIGYEPWHYRYVGVDVAQDVRASGLCFEEYLLLRAETLQEEGRNVRSAEPPVEDASVWDEIV